MTSRLDAETFATMYDAIMDADSSILSVRPETLRENYIETSERAKIFRQALAKLKIRQYVSVTSSKYGWVNIKSDQPDWDAFSEESYEEVQEMKSDIEDKLETIWLTLFPNIRNVSRPEIDYFSMTYSIN